MDSFKGRSVSVFILYVYAIYTAYEMLHGNWKLLLFARFLLVSCMKDNIMVRDYFMHKGIYSVVGFSCENLESA